MVDPDDTQQFLFDSINKCLDRIDKLERQQPQQDEKINEIRGRHITELHNIIKVQSDYIEKLERELKMLRWKNT